MCRTPSGKRLALTSRDLAIFGLLERYRYLRSTYLHAFAGGASTNRFKERLGDLFHEGYLDRPEQQWKFADARHHPVIYELGQLGREMLLRGGSPAPDAATYFSRSAHRQFEHAVTICDAVASIELATAQLPGLRFIPWGEILGRAPGTSRNDPAPFRIPTGDGVVIPDAIFGLEYSTDSRKAFRFFALEVDRATMPIARSTKEQTSYIAKLDRYRTAIQVQAQKTSLGVPNLLVLTLTIGQRRADEMLGAISGWKDSRAFLFKTFLTSELLTPMPALLAAPWARASAAPMSIERTV
jgi:hypothetical protein